MIFITSLMKFVCELQDFMSTRSDFSFKDFLRVALNGEESSNIEIRLNSKNQGFKDLVINTMPLRGESEEILGAFAFGWNVTDLKKSETREHEIKKFVETACAPIFGVDTSGMVNEWNDKSAELTGFPREEVLGKDLIELLIGAESRDSVRQVLDCALLGKFTENLELPIYTKEKRRVELLLNITPRKDVSGNVVGMLSVGQDITERKKMEVEKTSLAQELQTFIDTANAPIFGIDAFGLVNEWNNKSAEITGFSREEVLGKHLVTVC